MVSITKEQWEEYVKLKSGQKPPTDFCYTEDGALVVKVMAPKGSGFIEITMDECDKDYANDNFWRVNWVNGYPYVVSRSASAVYGAVSLAHLIAERKYGTRQFGTLTFRNKNRLDFTRYNLVSSTERNNEHRWVALIRQWLQQRKRTARQKFKDNFAAEKRARWEERQQKRNKFIDTVNKTFKRKKYEPNEIERGFDCWVGAFQIRPDRWQPWIKTPENLDPFNPVMHTTTFNSEQAALKAGYGLWLAYVTSAEHTKAREYAKAKLAPETDKLMVAFDMPSELSGIDE